jgi:ligand-binding SRPBCC domain-containing protein
MAVHSLKAVQNIPVTLERAWNFFSDPANLPSITPPSMSFKIISRHHGEKMYPGQIIEYTVSPVAGVRLYWMTEITHVSDQKFFIDEQRYGPYSMWHHQHHFKEIPGGVEMTDIVHYKNPLGFLGEMVNPFFVKPKLKDIFQYRFRQVNELFGGWDGQGVQLEMY